MIELLPCPFCGGEAEFERIGTRRQSCIVACTDCGGRLESGEEGEHCGQQWNSRHTPEDWQLVPLEANADMLEIQTLGYHVPASKRWRETLAVAPRPS